MATRRKPRVSIIHSRSSKFSRNGEDLSVYLAVCLQLGGYSDVRIIGFSNKATNSGGDTSLQSKRLSVIPYSGHEVKLPNHCECSRDGWGSVRDSNMVLLCVDPPDVDACAAALSSTLKEKDEVAVISFDLGLRNHPAVEKHLGGKNIILLSGAVGISVAASPTDGSLRSLGPGCLVVERLSKEQSKGGVKFVNLVRSGGIPVRHCRNVSCYTHGAALFNTCHAAAALSGSPMDRFLRDRYGRLLWAAMIREGLEVFSSAAGGGGWRLANPCCSLTLPQLELFLCLPTPLFNLLSRWLLDFPSNLGTSMRMDLAVGRETGVAWTLAEVVRIGDKHKVPVPASRTVLSAVTLAVRVGEGIPRRTPQSLLADAFGMATASASAQALKVKVAMWSCSVILGTWMLGMVGGYLLAATGLFLAVLVAIVSYVVVGDVVP